MGALYYSFGVNLGTDHDKRTLQLYLVSTLPIDHHSSSTNIVSNK